MSTAVAFETARTANTPDRIKNLCAATATTRDAYRFIQAINEHSFRAGTPGTKRAKSLPETANAAPVASLFGKGERVRPARVPIWDNLNNSIVIRRFGTNLVDGNPNEAGDRLDEPVKLPARRVMGLPFATFAFGVGVPAMRFHAAALMREIKLP